MGWTCLAFPNLQRCNCWSFKIDKLFYPMRYIGCNYLFMLGLKLIHVSKKGSMETTPNSPSPENKFVMSICHYNDVRTSAMASQITSPTIVCSTVYSRRRSKKHKSSASLAFVRGIHRWPVNSPHKGPVTLKMFPFDDVIMLQHVATTCCCEIYFTNNNQGMARKWHP